MAQLMISAEVIQCCPISMWPPRYLKVLNCKHKDYAKSLFQRSSIIDHYLVIQKLWGRINMAVVLYFLCKEDIYQF